MMFIVKRTIYWLIAVSAIFSAVSACDTTDRELDKLIAKVKQRSLIYSTATFDSGIIAQAFADNGSEYDLREYKSLFAHTTHSEDSICAEEAELDVNLFFEILKIAYPAYMLFGGSSVFETAKTNVLEKLHKLDSVLTREHLGKYLRDALYFINDAHFTINGIKASSQADKHMLLDPDTEWWQDNRGYYRWRGDDKQYLIGVSDTDPEYRLYSSISMNGRLCQRIYSFSDSDDVQETITIRIGNEIHYENIILRRGSDTRNLNRRFATFQQYRKSDIDVFRLMQCDSGTTDSMQRFIDTASCISRNELSILDLRGNPGGETDAVSEWIARFSGEGPQINRTIGEIINPSIDQFAEILGNKQQNSEAESLLFGTKSWRISTPELPLAPVPTPALIVFIDEWVASSAEFLVESLQRAQNVMFIGTHTAGVSLVAGNRTINLPYSAVSVNFGRFLLLNTDRTLGDNIGFPPDIAIIAKDRLTFLETAFSFIEYYGRENIANALR